MFPVILTILSPLHPSVVDLEASKASLESQVEAMLARLRELEGEKQELEARQVWGAASCRCSS